MHADLLGYRTSHLVSWSKFAGHKKLMKAMRSPGTCIVEALPSLADNRALWSVFHMFARQSATHQKASMNWLVFQAG